MRKIIFKKGWGGGGFGPYSPPPGSAPERASWALMCVKSEIFVYSGMGGGGGGVVHPPRILCHISILVRALEFCSTF